MANGQASQQNYAVRIKIFPFLTKDHLTITSLFLPRTRQLPKPVYSAAKLKRTMIEAERVKDERRRKHSRAGETKPKAARKKVVVAEQT